MRHRVSAWSKRAPQANGAIRLGGLSPKGRPGGLNPAPKNTVWRAARESGSAKQVSRGHGDWRAPVAWMLGYAQAPCRLVGWGSRVRRRPAWLRRAAAVGLRRALRDDAEPAPWTAHRPASGSCGLRHQWPHATASPRSRFSALKLQPPGGSGNGSAFRSAAPCRRVRGSWPGRSSLSASSPLRPAARG